MDFEDAARNAARTVLDCTWKGCFFHYAQCIWRRVQNQGMQISYKESDEIRTFVRRIAGLPLIPVDQVEEQWMDILDVMPDDPKCRALADYVTAQWIEGPLHIVQWNHYGNDGPRTNNHLEGWHHRLQKLVSKAHPNLYQFIDFLKKEQYHNETLLILYQAGGQQPAKRRRYRNIDSRLQVLRQRLETGAIQRMQYADACAQLLHFQ